LNWLDIVIITTIVAFVIAAYRAGLVRELVTLIALIAGIIVAGLLYDNLEREVLVFIDNEDAALAVSFMVLLGSVYLMGQLIAYTMKRGVTLLSLGWADHIGGAFFGLLKVLLIVEVLLLVFAAYPGLGLDGAVEGSALAPLFVDDVDFVLVLLPSDIDDRVGAFLNS
jgi:membrane protein required for colicin V production